MNVIVSAGVPPPEILKEAARVLKAGGMFAVVANAFDSMARQLTFAGFTNVVSDKYGFTATTPNYGSGAAVSLKTRKAVKAAEPAAAPVVGKNVVWGLGAEDLDELHPDEFMDEDLLVDLSAPPQSKPYTVYEIFMLLGESL